MRSDWIQPKWTAGSVLAGTTTRIGGVSSAPFDSFNLRFGEDSDEAVLANRQLLAERLGVTRVQYLNQVHGIKVIRASSSTCTEVPDADAMWTQETELALVIQTADCLPVLIAECNGRTIGAAHAGWRGLASGVLPALTRSMPCDPSDMLVWLGPCIGGASYEVGTDVREAFTAAMPSMFIEAAFKPGKVRGKWWCDLASLARAQLAGLGVPSTAISESGHCTLQDPQLFSWRRNRLTGRMASFLVRKAQPDC